MGNFLKRLQEADEGVKRVWIVIGTIVTVSVVFTVWLTFFNSLAPYHPPAVAADVPAEEAGVSFGDSLRGGAAMVGDTLSGLLHAAGSLFSFQREVIVKPGQ